MRHGRIDLDLTTHEFLTDPDVLDVAQIKAGKHYVRRGDAHPSAVSQGAHPDGEPLRIARDKFTGKYFAQVFPTLPKESDSNHAERQLERADKLKPFHVPGHGYWVPLEEIYPDHPHVKIFNRPTVPDATGNSEPAPQV